MDAVCEMLSTRARARSHPAGTGELIDRFSPHQLRLERAAALEGAWEPFHAGLRVIGAAHAAAGRDVASLLGPIEDARREATTWLRDNVRDPDELAELQRGLADLRAIETEHTLAGYVTAIASIAARGERRARALFEHSPQPMWTFDLRSARYTDVNAAALALYGFTREEFLALTLFDLRMPEEHDSLREDIRANPGLIDGRLSIRSRRHRRADDRDVTVDMEIRAIEVDGDLVHLAIVDDATEREEQRAKLERAEDRLRHTQKMEALGRLASAVAHDFNNLLTVILTNACFVEDALPDGQPRMDANEIRRAAERGTALTRQLLVLGRHGHARAERLDVDEMLANLTSMLRKLLGEGIQLAVHAGKPHRVMIDAGQLEQIVINLAVNARDAMPGGGKLGIETSELELAGEAAAMRGLQPGRYAAIAVTDAGTGMDADTKRRMFEPFFTTKEAGKGTGLGLSIVHGIVEQARGAISVYSELGHGTTFRVYLPVVDGGDAAPRLAITEAPVTLPAMTVLVVDDEPEVRAVAARVLREAGCRVVEAATAEEARRLCATHDRPFDVALIDVVLGEERGDVLVRNVLELQPQLRAVLMSGYPARALSNDGGPVPDLLPKPFSPSELRGAIAKAIADPAGEGEPALAVAAPTHPQRRVLLVDDDDTFRRTVSRGLSRAGFEVVQAADGQQALAALGGRGFDAILSDIRMPQLDGIELLREVRRVDLDVPVILMSGTPDLDTATSAVEYGAFRYLTKPLDIVAACELIAKAARVHALARIRREAQAIGGGGARAADRAGLEVRFDAALSNLYLQYQPIVRANGAPYGFEALMRSREPSMAVPDAILEAASTLRRLAALGRRVRSLAATGGHDGMLFVNLHPDDLADADLVDPDSPLAKLAPRVVLEITERSELPPSGELASRIARLRELGFRLAIDDIGAGYSGLTSFAEVMPEIVKIDMSLVRDVHRSALKQRTIAALCTLCHEVGGLVVGEGVESTMERECLVGLGCDLLQGFLIGRPA
nr:response regulator [Kofleriaceae bacterium]